MYYKNNTNKIISHKNRAETISSMGEKYVVRNISRPVNVTVEFEPILPISMFTIMICIGILLFITFILVMGLNNRRNGSLESDTDIGQEQTTSTPTTRPPSQPAFPLAGTTWVFVDRDGKKHTMTYEKNTMTYSLFGRGGSLEQTISGTYTLNGNRLTVVYEGSQGVTITKTYTQIQIIDNGYIYTLQR